MKKTPARKPPSGVSSRWMTFWAVCTVCGHKWQAVMPNMSGPVSFPCPKCKEWKSDIDQDRQITPENLARAMDYATEIEAVRRKQAVAKN